MNCKPGDIAMITSQPNYGRLVEVLEWHGVRPDSSDNWEVKALQSVVRITGPRAGQTAPAGTLGYCRDAYLKPFQPPPEEETFETEKELETT